jgi:prostaglandin-E synthase
LATKVDKTSFWPRLPKDASKHRWIKVDFSKFVDEDEEAELPLENPDFLKMMSGMPGMPGMPPHDSDDEEEEEQ